MTCRYIDPQVLPKSRRTVLLKVPAIIVAAVGCFLAPHRVVSAPITLIAAPNATDFVADERSGILYITSGSQVLRYNLASQAFLSPFNLGGSLTGIDLSQDGSRLLVADSSHTSTEAWFYDVNPTSGASQTITYAHASREAGAYQVRIAADGTAILSSKQAWGSVALPIRQYDLATMSVSVISYLYQGARVSSAADGSVVVVSAIGTSPSTVLRYSSATGDLSQNFIPSLNLSSTGVAVNSDGTESAAFTSGGARIYDQDWHVTKELDPSQFVAPIGMAYDAVRDVLYDAEVNTTHIDAYDTQTWQKTDSYELPYEFNFTAGSGRLRTSDDGQYLFALAPGTGIYAIVVPEPSMVAMLLGGGLGGGVIVLVWRRRR